MDTLAADLRQAADDLLDVPQARPAEQARPPPRDLPTYSSASKLVPIASPTGSEDRTTSPINSHLAPVAVRQPIKLAGDALSSDVEEDAEDDDRFKALSTRTLPLRPSSANLVGQASPSRSTLTSPASATAEFFRRATASPSNRGRGHKDVWLNARGERVIDGSVVSKLALADGEPEDSASSRLVAVNGADEERAGDDGETSGSGLLGMASSTSTLRASPFDPSHGSQSRLHTPRFFIQSFPDAMPASSSPHMGAYSDAEEHAAEIVRSQAWPVRSPPSSSSRVFAPSSKQEAAGVCLTNINSDVVHLHGNKRAEREAEEQQAQLYTDEALRPEGEKADQTLLDRATSLFTTQLDSPPHERKEIDAGPSTPSTSARQPEANDHVNDITASPDETASLRSLSQGDSSSLVSLPVSSIPGSTDTSSTSRRHLLRRTSSTGSARSRHSRSLSTSSNGGGGVSSANVFARDVRVRGWSEVGGRTRGYVTFEIVLLTKKGLTIRAHRRYSSFVSLRRDLLAEAPHHAPALPGLPPKDVLHKFSAKHLEMRRLALQRWLTGVMLDARWGGRRACREWLVGSEGG
ncbi:hypothetical protein BDZ90DRAFT_233717 [Jaminaea rosea]|uniref:Endosomal/vacuolar adapter protein YPT35 n=1 Tax=Jaminaea rosea TaxID=1569628 RepID=A0A316UKF1_9BASI|nr:hypothetical protein BDZ90DRAFT_233717 [Jaminaea rosea]PWN25709.1 hypothetical protein BDZ90DRAFT_233717 [Jaminaea rosea]